MKKVYAASKQGKSARVQEGVGGSAGNCNHKGPSNPEASACNYDRFAAVLSG